MKEHIFCPKCGSFQQAEVLPAIPWPIYVHDCTACGYIITESEWNKATVNEVAMYSFLYKLFTATPGMAA